MNSEIQLDQFKSQSILLFIGECHVTVRLNHIKEFLTFKGIPFLEFVVYNKLEACSRACPEQTAVAYVESVQICFCKIKIHHQES